MGKKGKKKGINRMPVSQGHSGAPSTSNSPKDSATDLKSSTGSPEDVVDVDNNDKQTLGELSDNMSSSLSQVESASPQNDINVTASEGTKENEDKAEESPALKDANTEKPANNVAATTTIAVGNTEGEEIEVNGATKDTAGAELGLVEENGDSQEIAAAPSDEVAMENGSKGEGAEPIENAISTEVIVRAEGATGEAGDGAETPAVEAEVETNSIKDTISADDPPSSEEAGTSDGPPASKEVAPPGEPATSDSQEITTEDTRNAAVEESTVHADGSTSSEDATFTDDSGSSKEPAASGETPPGSQSPATTSATPQDGPTVDGKANEESRPLDGDNVTAEETATGGEPAAEEEGRVKNIEDSEASKGGTTTAEEPGPVPEKPHVAACPEVEVSLEAVEPEVGAPAEEAHIQEHTEITPVLDEVEPDVSHTEDLSILGAGIEAILDEVTPEPNAENEEDSDPANTKQTGGQAESTDDIGSGEEEATPSEITAPSTEGGSVCGDSTASEVTAATEDTTTDDASTDKAAASGETTTTAKEGAPIEQAIGEAPVSAEAPTTERSPPSEEDQNSREGLLKLTDESQAGNRCSSEGPAGAEGIPAELPTIENAPIDSETPTVGKSAPVEGTPSELSAAVTGPDASPKTEASPTEIKPLLSVDEGSITEAEVSPPEEALAPEPEATSAGAGDPTEAKVLPTEAEAPKTEAPPAETEAPATDTAVSPTEPTVVEPESLPKEQETPAPKPPAAKPEGLPTEQKTSPAAEPPTVEPEALPTEQESLPAAGPPPAKPEATPAEQGAPIIEPPTETKALPVAPVEALPPSAKLDANNNEETPPTNREYPQPEEARPAKPEEPLIEIAMPTEGDVAVEDGPPGEQAQGAASGDVPASPTSRRRRLHWSPENGDETLLGQIIRPHRARRESDASVFTIKAGKGMPDSNKHHHRRRESGASGHSRGDRESLKKKARTPEEEEERRKRKEAKAAMSPEERDERRKRKEARKAAKEPDQFVIGGNSGDKASPDKPRHRHERHEGSSPSKPLSRPKLLRVFSDESDFKSPIFWISAGATEIQGMRHPSEPPSPKSPRSPKSRRHSHQSPEEKEAHRLRREERRREKEGQDAQKRELKEEKPPSKPPSKTPSHASQEANASPPNSSHRKHRTKEHHREHHRSSKRGKERTTDGDSPMTVFRRVEALCLYLHACNTNTYEQNADATNSANKVSQLGTAGLLRHAITPVLPRDTRRYLIEPGPTPSEQRSSQTKLLTTSGPLPGRPSSPPHCMAPKHELAVGQVGEGEQ